MALDAHLLNYVDHETPRRYFIRADADVEEVERFAALVAAHEREACAKLCDENGDKWADGNDEWRNGQATASYYCAIAIRARSEA